MIKRAVGISMAFVGVLVGAGFASGQEAMQYFVSFGEMGLWGVLVAAVLTTITGIAVLQLGSYFQANEHTAFITASPDRLLPRFWISAPLLLCSALALSCSPALVLTWRSNSMASQFSWVHSLC